MSKKTISSVITVAILVVLVVLWLKKDQISFLNKAPDLVLKADVNLSASDRAFVEKRLAENEAKLAELGEKATLVEKVNLNFVISADYRLLGEYGKAKEILEASMALEPNNSNAKSTYSSLLAVMGDKKGALDYINQAIELYPKETNYWLWKFELEKELGAKGSKLEAMYKDALERTEGDLNIVTVYAKFLENEGRNDEAMVYWEKAIELYPENNGLYQAEIDALKEKSQ